MMTKKAFRIPLVLEWVAITLIATGFLLWSTLSGTTQKLDNPLLNKISTLSASAADPNILIVAIDDHSLAREGHWPWRRDRMANLVDELAKGGSKFIELDILYSETTDKAQDQALADAFTRAGNVILPISFVPATDMPDGIALLRPIDALSRGAKAMGHVGLSPDDDGHIRRIVPTVWIDGRPIDHMQVTAARLLGKPCRVDICADAGAGWIIPFRPTGSYRTISASSILNGELPASLLAGTTALVGATATGLGDSHFVTHFSDVPMPGVEIQANMLQAIQEGTLIRPVSGMGLFWLCLPLVLVQFLIFRTFAPGRGFILTLCLILAALSASIAALVFARLWIAPGSIMVALALGYPLWSWRRLTAVSAFLVDRAERLLATHEGPAVEKAKGLDDLARQITQLDTLVDEVNERRSFLKSVIESTPDSIFVFGPDDKLLLMNHHASSLVDDESVSDGKTTLLDRIVQQGHNPPQEINWHDGRVFSVNQERSDYGFGKGRIRMLILRDITEARKAELERQQMLEILSHDMRSPQVAILSLAANRAELEDSQRLERIRTHARQTLSLANNFIQLARLAEVPLDIAECDVAALVDEAMDRAWILAQEKSISLASKNDGVPVLGACDSSVIARVLDNLIGNAIKYCPSGARITVSAQEDPTGDQVMIEVQDNGPGLPPERRNEPFQRFTASDGRGQSAGLGLTFVLRAVEQHGGVILCDCPADGGTRFSIALPAKGIQVELQTGEAAS